jgi:glucoamylase
LFTWKKQGSLEVTAVSQPFFRQFSANIATGTYASNSPTFTSLVSAISSYADGFVAIVAKNTPSNGGLAEQYSRSNGTPLSAVDLTWSYASALTAFQARTGKVSGAWGANGLKSTCGGSGGGGTVAVTFNVQATTVFGGACVLNFSGSFIEPFF